MPAQHDQPAFRVEEAEPGSDAPRDEVQALGLRQRAGREDFAQAFALGLVGAGEHHHIAGGDGVEFVADALDVAGQALDRLDAEVAVCRDRGTRQRGDADVGEAHELGEHGFDAEQAGRVGEAVVIGFGLLGEFADFDEGDSGAFGQVVAEVAGEFGGGFSPERRQVRVVERAERPLRLRRELADRLHLVAEEFEAVRRFRVGRVDVEDAAAPAELRRCLDDFRRLIALRDEPAGQFVGVEDIADADAASAERGAVGHLLEQRLDGREQQTRRIGLELAKHAQALAGDLVEDADAWRVVPGREDSRFDAGEAVQVRRPGVEIARVSDDDERRALRQGRDRACAGRTPRAIDGGAPAGGQRAQDRIEPFDAGDPVREVGERDRRGDCLGHGGILRGIL